MPEVNFSLGAAAELHVHSPSVAEQQLLVQGPVLLRGRDGIWQLVRFDEVAAHLLLTFRYHPAGPESLCHM